ncbi:MAG: glycerol-3-phosphate dehydrogenase/oxidase [Caldilineaceae bacterium]|nr:glycerol-3-phosphate dehydrogenase/oxidase [Caldilineaceae bacterium]
MQQTTLVTPMNRSAILNQLQQQPNRSVLIIGGGVNGIATFRDLALQGVDVLLIDRADFCSGASAASSHMAHGGIRYLENGEFRLVREAVEERNRLIQNAPHYVTPLPTVIPIFKWFSGLFNAPLKFLGLLDRPAERGAAIIKLGLLMYDAYTGATRTVPRHEFLTRTAALARYPDLNPTVVSVAQYYDGLIRAPERLCVEMVADAEAASPQAHALNYVSVAGAAGNQVQLRDELTGTTFPVRPQLVINAAGPWIDVANERLGQPTQLIGGTKGSHLVLDHPALRQAIGEHEFFFENSDGRIVLICPLEDRVLVGTSDLRLNNPDEAVCTDEEIDYFLGMTARVFPKLTVNRSQVVFTFSGVRPLPSGKSKTTGQISRDHSIEVLEPRDGLAFPIFNLVGGKWTTFRAFAEQATDQALTHLGKRRQNHTAAIAIGGGRGYPTTPPERVAWIEQQHAQSGLSSPQIDTLLHRYGTLAAPLIADLIAHRAQGADQPLQQRPDYLRGEIAYLARTEKVIHLDDFVLRRTSLGMLGLVTRPLLAELAEIIGEIHGWSAAEREAEVRRAISLLAQRHRVQLS